MPYKNPADKAAAELARYYRRREETIAEFGGECIECGSNEKLEFDHIDPENKLYNVSRFWSLSKVRLEEELEKCQLLCIDCHKEKHKADHGYYMYNRGCRCETCRIANTNYMRQYRERRSGLV